MVIQNEMFLVQDTVTNIIRGLQDKACDMKVPDCICCHTCHLFEYASLDVHMTKCSHLFISIDSPIESLQFVE